MKRIFLLLLILLLAVAAWRIFFTCTSTGNFTANLELRVMSFNINTFHSETGNASRMQVSTVLQMYRPQVVCLQEVVLESRGQSLEEFAAANGYPFVRSHEQYIINKRVGIAVLSHYSILRDTVFHVGPQSELRYAQAIVLDVNGREVTVMNTHFSNRDFWKTAGRLQALKQEFFTENLRTLQAQSIVNFLDSGWAEDPLLLAGDLNTLPFSRAWRKLRSRLRGTASWRDLLQPTYKVEYQVHIDYILASHSLHKKEYRILPTMASDHNPLLVTFVLEGEPVN